MHCATFQEGNVRRAAWQHDRRRFYDENAGSRLEKSQGGYSVVQDKNCSCRCSSNSKSQKKKNPVGLACTLAYFIHDCYVAVLRTVRRLSLLAFFEIM